MIRKMPDDAEAVAQELFSVLRTLDAGGASEIWIEAPPETAEWEGVRDRLTRAAAAGPPILPAGSDSSEALG